MAISNNDFQKAVKLRHLRVIAALSDLKLLARVADELNITQPAVSKQIAELEKIVGVPIVTRDRNRLFLTPIGHRLVVHAKQALNQLDRAAFDLEAMASGISGAVAIGVVSSVAPTLLPSTIALFKSSTPEADISVREGHFVELIPELQDWASRCGINPNAGITSNKARLSVKERDAIVLAGGANSFSAKRVSMARRATEFACGIIHGKSTTSVHLRSGCLARS